MLKRFVFAFIAFIGLVVPAAFALALLAAPPASPAPLQQPGCDRNLADADHKQQKHFRRFQIELVGWLLNTTSVFSKAVHNFTVGHVWPECVTTLPLLPHGRRSRVRQSTVG